MDVSLLRQLWSVIESSVSSSPRHRLSSLDDPSLLQWLVDALQADPAFDPQDVPAGSHYIRARLPLIRDMAQ